MKRKIICLAGLIVGMLVCWVVPGLADDEVIIWRMQVNTKQKEGLERNRRLAEEVKYATAGRLVWEVYPVGAIVHPQEGLEAVSNGVYEVNLGNAFYWVNKVGSAATLFSHVPTGFNLAGLAMWFEYGGGKELHQELFDRHGFRVKVFQIYSDTMQNFLWAKKPLRTLEDFRGLRMRMEPGMGDALSRHGISVIYLQATEILRSLQTGVVDAVEYASAAGDRILEIWTVCKYVMLPGVHHPSGAAEVLINKAAYEALPDEMKKQLEIAIYSAGYKRRLRFYAEDLDAMEFFKEQGVETVMMDPETVETFAKWAREWLEEQAAQDEFFAKVWNSQKAFAEKWYPYIRTHTLPH